MYMVWKWPLSLPLFDLALSVLIVYMELTDRDDEALKAYVFMQQVYGSQFQGHVTRLE